MSVKCRLVCDKYTPYEVDGEVKYVSVGFSAVYSSDPTDPNYSFSTATPSARLDLTISNPAAFNQYEFGKTYNFTSELYEAPKPLTEDEKLEAVDNANPIPGNGGS